MSTKDFEQDEMKRFDSAFGVISKVLTKPFTPELEIVSNWLKSVLAYNVPHGKKNRGLAVYSAFKILTANKANADDLDKACYLGWCVELLQAHFLVVDDVMDQSLTRRGQPCWYKKEEVGLTALNDSFLLYDSVYDILNHYYKDHPCYSYMLQLFLKTHKYTSFGQGLDMITSTKWEPETYKLYTMERYNAIIKYKTAFYSFSLPIRLALYAANIIDQASHDLAEDILIRMGMYFQVQDDYLDCFADSKVIGKIGMDIEDAKCCWPVVTALSLVNDEQRKVLIDNYGRNDPECVKRVKNLYKVLGIEKIYVEYEKNEIQAIDSMIEKINLPTLPKSMFSVLFAKIAHRLK